MMAMSYLALTYARLILLREAMLLDARKGNRRTVFRNGVKWLLQPRVEDTRAKPAQRLQTGRQTVTQSSKTTA